MMEEVGYRTAIYSLEGVTGSQRQYMTWLIDTCATDGVGIDDVLEPAAVDLLAARLRTPLQIGGSFKDPSFHPEAGPLILRTAAAAALYSVAPPAALLALIETGPGKDIDCGPARGS